MGTYAELRRVTTITINKKGNTMTTEEYIKEQLQDIIDNIYNIEDRINALPFDMFGKKEYNDFCWMAVVLRDKVRKLK